MPVVQVLLLRFRKRPSETQTAGLGSKTPYACGVKKSSSALRRLQHLSGKPSQLAGLLRLTSISSASLLRTKGISCPRFLALNTTFSVLLRSQANSDFPFAIPRQSSHQTTTAYRIKAISTAVLPRCLEESTQGLLAAARESSKRSSGPVLPSQEKRQSTSCSG